MHADTCLLYVFKQRKMLINNFGTRGQIDLIGYSATPNGPCKYLLCYRDNSIKLANHKPLTSKYLIVIACGLLSMFSVTGPPNTLQSNNTGKFSNIARKK